MKANGETNHACLNRAYDAARAAGKVHTSVDFANLTQTNRSFLSQMLNGSIPITDRTLQRILDKLEQNGIVIQAQDQSQVVATGTNYGEQKILDGNASEIVQTLTAEMASQRELYAKNIERLLNMLEREQNTREELIKRLQ